jgi:hypothetical protein
MATQLEQDLNDSSLTLDIYASSTCGKTWKKISTVVGTKLINAGFVTSAYTAGKADQYWKRAVVDLSSAGSQFKTTGVRFKFAVTSNKHANNFFFDNFNLGNSTLGIDPTELGMAIDLYPNPTKDVAELEISSEKQEKVTVVLNDMLGNKITELFSGNAAVNQKVSIPTATLSTGMYIVQINANGKIIQKKLIKM